MVWREMYGLPLMTEVASIWPVFIVNGIMCEEHD
jgi:hypothetical protein